jgi:chloride channel 3/4/5
MIWSNGFPFLDNKEDHVFNVPVSHVMTSDPLSLPASEYPVREIGHLLNDNKFQGFPIVEDRYNKILVGYIGRTELQYAVDKTRRTGPVSPNAKCVFTKEAAGAASLRSRTPTATRPNDAPQTFDELEDSTGSKVVDFSPYVDHTPISVHPRLPLETVMELFKKMGPRVILVEHRGRITGLVTVKDCLKYQFKVEAQENATENGPSPSGSGFANGHVDDPGHATTLEEKIWGLLQRLGESLRIIRNRGVRLDGHSRGPHQRQQSSESAHQNGGILDGTEEDDTVVELEDRI